MRMGRLPPAKSMVKFDGMRISFGLFDAAALSRLRPKVVMALDMMLADITRAIDAISVTRTAGLFIMLE